MITKKVNDDEWEGLSGTFMMLGLILMMIWLILNSFKPTDLLHLFLTAWYIKPFYWVTRGPGFREVWRLAFVKTEDWKTLKILIVKTEEFKIA